MSLSVFMRLSGVCFYVLFSTACSEPSKSTEWKTVEETKQSTGKNQQTNSQAAQNQSIQNQQLKFHKQFEQWKGTQDAQLIAEYEKFFQAKVKQAPTLYELTLNSHPLSEACQQHRFSLPPKKLWSNLVEPLQLIEHLQQAGYFSNYKIVSVYRSQQANTCVHGAQASKHLNNFAVDFQTLDVNLKPYANHDEIDQKLCQFWRRNGKKYSMGLGLYSKQRFHLDTQGYRTWGIGFKSVSSPCLHKTINNK